MRTAASARDTALAALDRAYRFAKELENYGPEYATEGAAAAFATVSAVIEHHPPDSGEDAAAWSARVTSLARAKLAEYGNDSPAALEAILMIG